MLAAALERVAVACGARIAALETRVVPGLGGPKELAQAMTRISTRTPALLLSCDALGAGDYAGGDAYEYQAGLVLFCLLRDRAGSARLDGVLDDLIVPLLGWIPGQTWGGEPWARGADQPTAQSVFATEIDAQGIAVWAIAWDQALRLPRLRT